jgi:hypothetical protein
VPGIDGAPALDGEVPLCGLLGEEELLLRELLLEDELLVEDELLEGMELLLVGICAEGGWLLVEVVLQPPASDSSTMGSSSRGAGVFTRDTCTSR